jgi:hypothetical protein
LDKGKEQMKTTLTWLGRVALIGLVAGASFAWIRQSEVRAQNGGGSPRYTVVQTDITNLLVVDNGTNLIHFYTGDPGKEPGSELKCAARST